MAWAQRLHNNALRADTRSIVRAQQRDQISLLPIRDEKARISQPREKKEDYSEADSNKVEDKEDFFFVAKEGEIEDYEIDCSK